MNRRGFVRYGCSLSLLGGTGGCLSDGWGTDPHTETITVYNRLDGVVTVSLDVRRSEKRVFSGRESILASGSWDVPDEFGVGSYDLSVEVSAGPSARTSWEVPEDGPDRGLGVEMRRSGIEIIPWVD
ncbi:hypothetical protein V5735_07890 (plasmid) [Haladaptatus sp. SPP-AMP-3]|uniref:hypothetical protein n=1 Tax=Haladaptatus sp. SPP-AMP-3 TaxID=3121295 RepID=UPI003C2D8686